jgi:Fe2+ or Zn2+ uptake regulation protein
MEGKRNTIQRQLIFDSVKEIGMHATAEQVFEHVVRKYPSISKATVYRNLNQIAESGELSNIGSFFGSVHYDQNCHKHYHFVCEFCKRVFDVEDDFPDILVRIQDTYGFDITDISFNGICGECKSKKNT